MLKSFPCENFAKTLKEKDLETMKNKCYSKQLYIQRNKQQNNII